MKKLRRAEALGMALVLAAALAGCSSKNSDAGSQTEQPAEAQTVEAEVKEEAPTVESLMQDVQLNLRDVTSLQTRETIDFGSTLSMEGESMDLGMKMDLDYQMISKPVVSGYLNMEMSVDVDGESQTYSSETYLEQDGDRLIAYNTSDGVNFQAEEDDLNEYDLSELADQTLYYSIEKGEIEASLRDDTEKVGGSDAYVLDMTLAGDQFEEVISNSFSELQDGDIIPEDTDWDSVSADTVLYIDKDSRLPVMLTIDCTSLGDALITSMLGEEDLEGMDVEISRFDLAVEYSGYNALSPVEIPEAAKSGAVIEEEGDDGTDDGDDSGYTSVTEGSLTMTDGVMTAVVEVPEGFDNLTQTMEEYVSAFGDAGDAFYAFSSMDVDKYLEYESDVEWMIESDSYSDVTVSEVKTKKVGNYEISYIVVEYTYSDNMYCNEIKTVTDLGSERLTVDIDSYSFDQKEAVDESIIDTVYAAVTIQ